MRGGNENATPGARFAGLDSWWQGLSARERTLLGVLGLLLGVVVIIFGVVKPIHAERARAIADIRTYETLNARILAAGSLDTAPAGTRRTGTPQSIVSGAASSAGLDVSIADSGGTVRATVASGDYAAVLRWISDVTQNSSLSVTRVDLTRTATAGQVAGSVDFVA